MPIYEYKCKKYGYEFELIQKFTDPTTVKCPKCGGKAVRIISSRVAFNFKGTGFYANDYNKPDSTSHHTKQPKKQDKKKK